MRKATLAALALAVSWTTACQDSSGNETTRLTILLTDAPGDVTEAVVTISGIYLQGDGDPNSASGRVVLLSNPVTTDLLELEGDLQTLVDGALVPSGTYGQLRFVIDGAYLKVEDEAGDPRVFSTPGYSEAPAQVDGTLLCPSCSQTGIKVTVPGGLELDGSLQTLIVDFDVKDSFGKEAGQSSNWVMHPTLKAAKPAP